MKDKRDACLVLVEKPEERDYLHDTGVEGRIILRRYSGSRMGAMD